MYSCNLPGAIQVCANGLLSLANGAELDCMLKGPAVPQSVVSYVMENSYEWCNHDAQMM